MTNVKKYKSELYYRVEDKSLQRHFTNLPYVCHVIMCVRVCIGVCVCIYVCMRDHFKI